MADSAQALIREFLSGSAWVFTGRLTAIAAAVAVNALLARLLEPAAFGVYVLATSIVTVTAVLGCLGLNSAVVRLLGQSHGVEDGRRTRTIIKQCLVLGLAGGVIVGFAMASPAGAWLADRAFSSALLVSCLTWMGVWVFALVAQTLVVESLRGIKCIHLAAMVGGPIAGIALLVALVGVATSGLPLSATTAVALSACATVIAFPIGVYLLWRHTRPASDTAFLSGSEIAGLALPMLVTNLSLILLNQADVWVVGAFLPSSELALYGAALQIASLISFPLLVLNAVVPPHIAENHELGRRAVLEHSLRRATGVAAYASIVGFLICVAAGAWLLELIYGEYYRQAALILVVIAFGRMVNVLAGPCGLVLLMTGYHRQMMWVNILTGVIAVLAMILIVRRYGMLGVAAVAASMMIVQNVVMLALAHSKSGVWTHAELNPKALLSS